MWYFKISFGVIVALFISFVALVIDDDHRTMSELVCIIATIATIWMLVGIAYICVLSLFGGVTIIL